LLLAFSLDDFPELDLESLDLDSDDFESEDFESFDLDSEDFDSEVPASFDLESDESAELEEPDSLEFSTEVEPEFLPL